ncbi:MAG: thiamine phosphate synthase [Treponema sp.]|jgi:thiamine-phosphate pyrophosphorylase|nr:thiamine phosphate synthase [Treponema sp.]
MFEFFAITDRSLCPQGNAAFGNAAFLNAQFLAQIEKIAASGVKAVILREKDLSLKDYLDLARDVLKICTGKKVKFIVHGLPQAAQELGCPYLHLPWTVFKENCPSLKDILSFGVSVHNTEEAKLAIAHGASWLIGGHIYTTQCKDGLEGRGPEFLAELCKLSSVPVYGIGGINEHNITSIVKTGAAGACLMSSLMQSPDPSALISAISKRVM